jgi:hypothetical protein
MQTIKAMNMAVALMCSIASISSTFEGYTLLAIVNMLLAGTNLFYGLWEK